MGAATSGDTGGFLVRVRALPPKRDAFALALGALRRRLRQGIDAPGDALPIQLVAQDLRLSTTPVREALSRLAGEHLVDKRGPTYTRPRLDGPTLAALYNLRLIYLSAALAPDVRRRTAEGRATPRACFDFPRELADGARPPSMIEVLFLDLMRAVDDPVLVQAYQQIADRLAPFHALEVQALDDIASEALALVTAFGEGRIAELRAGVRRYHRRRMGRSHVLVRLAEGKKYRTDIV